MGQAECEKKKRKKKERKKEKVIIPIHSNLIWNKEFPKNSKKCKNLKYIIMASFKAKTVRGRLRMI